ncbi:UNVERIFIED_CONTAM: transporter [Mumia flava]|uniref:sodium/solute symporter n=1 Tax=Mumia flava TaxID=1348852 RepID=UPI0005739DE0|nr:cation acetate symporter [Mumia flava]
MNSTYAAVAVIVVAVVTLAIGFFGLRFSRTTSDFYVASRSVSPLWNGSAIGGEYLSAASYLGIAGLILTYGADMLWFSVGWTAGYLLLLAFVAAPLRRSGAYTLPDFTQIRVPSPYARALASVLVVVIGWLYLMPQFQGAGLVLHTVTGSPPWVGAVLVAVVVVVNVISGGMRSITFVQAFQYWLKLTALGVPLIFLLHAWTRDGRPSPADVGVGEGWLSPLSYQGTGIAMYATYSLMIALFLGTMGLPHVVVRFYTNPDGDAARRTTLLVLGLLGLFYLMPAMYGLIGRVYASDLAGTGHSDIVVLALPGRMIGGSLGDVLGALLTAGAFAAFLSTSSGLTMSIAGVVAQGPVGRWVAALRPAALSGPATEGVPPLRVAAVLGASVPLLLALVSDRIAVASSVGFAFAVAASTFCPLLVLGIWWRRLTAPGAIAGMLAGGLGSGAAVVATIVRGSDEGWLAILLARPAAWSVSLAFVVMIVVSLATARRVPPNVSRVMVRLHAPERVRLSR